ITNNMIDVTALNASNAGTYTFVFEKDGCDSTVSFNLNINPKPVFAVQEGTTDLWEATNQSNGVNYACSGGQVTYNVTNATGTTATLVGSPAGFTINGSTITFNAPRVSAPTDVTFSVQVEDNTTN